MRAAEEALALDPLREVTYQGYIRAPSRRPDEGLVSVAQRHARDAHRIELTAERVLAMAESV